MRKINFIKIGTRKIGPNFRPLVIFELGINHNGSVKSWQKKLLIVPLKLVEK